MTPELLAESREELIEKALKLQAKGFSYLAIGRMLGRNRQVVREWLDPEFREKRRRASRVWKASHREATRQYDAERHARERGTCTSCGGRMGRGMPDDGVCRACLREAREKRGELIEAWWAEGLTIAEIGERLGWTSNQANVEIHYYRRDGFNLPYRYTSGKRAGSKFSAQVPA